jgi:hypothetical protein
MSTTPHRRKSPVVHLESERLSIHGYEIVPNEQDGCCWLFVGTKRALDNTPRPVVTMIVANCMGGTLHWIETLSSERRLGFASEFLSAIEARYGTFDKYPGSEDGSRFLATYGGPHR